MGTPEFAVPSLEALHRTGVDIIVVVCQPDRPSGRGMSLKPPPVKVAAQKLGLTVMQPEKLIEPGFRQFMEGAGLDMVLVTAYGKILRKWFLDLPRLGCFNVHASLLPRHRGASPIHAAVLEGDAETGITMMKLDEGMDTGGILVQESIVIGPHENVGSVHDRLMALGGKLVEVLVDRARHGDVTATPQDDSRATLAPKLTDEFGEIPWESPVEIVDRRVRGLTPSPGAFTWSGDQRVKILEAIPLEKEGREAAPGTVIRVEKDGVVVATGTAPISITSFQWPGKKAMAVRDYLLGHQIAVGTRFGRAASGEVA